MTDAKIVGSIEAGGTKFIVAAQDTESGRIVATDRIPTTSREEIFKACAEFFRKGPVNVLGIATFGPVDINPDSCIYGHILDTSKPGWSGANFKGLFEKELNILVYITIDINGSCYGEYIARGVDNTKTYLYVTIGTGISGDIIQEDKFIGRSYYPEMGYMMVVRAEDDDYKGSCLLHDACVEGMAAGPNLKGRTGILGKDLPGDHKALNFLQYYVAQTLYNAYVTTRPDVMVVGGSVLNEDDLVQIRKYFDDLNNSYVATPDLDELVTRPTVANNGSATLGDFELAKKLLEQIM